MLEISNTKMCLKIRHTHSKLELHLPQATGMIFVLSHLPDWNPIIHTFDNIFFHKLVSMHSSGLHLDGLVQDCGNSSALAMELLSPCTKPSIGDSINTFKPMWPGDTIWRHRSGSTLVQVMACCLMAPKPLPESMLTNHQWVPVTITWGQFYKRYLRHQ